jgi:CARDB
MKHFRFTKLTIAAAIAFCAGSNVSLANQIGTAPGRTLQPAPAASWPSLKRADLTSAAAGAQFGFVIRNVGTGDAAASTTTIKCRAYTSNTPGQGTYIPCRQGTHYTSAPAMPPPGTVSSGDTWKVPTPALAATSGQFTFTLGIKPVPPLRSLNFEVCADANNAISELNEGNNCFGFTYTWPN